MIPDTATKLLDIALNTRWIESRTIDAIGKFHNIDIVDEFLVQGRYAGRFICERGRTVADVMACLDQRRTSIIEALWAEACEEFLPSRPVGSPRPPAILGELELGGESGSA